MLERQGVEIGEVEAVKGKGVGRLISRMGHLHSRDATAFFAPRGSSGVQCLGLGAPGHGDGDSGVTADAPLGALPIRGPWLPRREWLDGCCPSGGPLSC